MSQLPPLSLLPDKPDLDKTFESTASRGLEGSDNSTVDLREFVLFGQNWGISGGDSIAIFDQFSDGDEYLQKDEFSDAMDVVYTRGINAMLYTAIGIGFPNQEAFSSGLLQTTGAFNIEASWLKAGAEEWSDFFSDDEDDDDNPWAGF